MCDGEGNLVPKFILQFVENSGGNDEDCPRLSSGQLEEIQDLLSGTAGDAIWIENEGLVESISTLLSSELSYCLSDSPWSLCGAAMKLKQDPDAEGMSDSNIIAKAVNQITYYLRVCECISLHLMRQSSRGHVNIATVFSEEVIEGCVACVTKTVASNFSVIPSTSSSAVGKEREKHEASSPVSVPTKRKRQTGKNDTTSAANKSSSGARKSSADGPGKSGSKKDILTEELELEDLRAADIDNEGVGAIEIPVRTMQLVTRSVAPIISSVLLNLRLCYGTHSQSDRLSIALCEMCFTVLKSNLPVSLKRSFHAAQVFTSESPRLGLSTGSPVSSGKLHRMDPPITPSGRHRFSHTTTAATTTTPKKPAPSSTRGGVSRDGRCEGIGGDGPTSSCGGPCCASSNVQSGAILFLGDVFRCNSTQRGFVLQEACNFLAHCYSLPKSYPRIHIFPIGYAPAHSAKSLPLVSSPAALVLTLVQCVSGAQLIASDAAAHSLTDLLEDCTVPTACSDGLSNGSTAGRDISVDVTAVNDTSMALQKGCVNDCSGVAASIITSVLKRCHHRETCVEYRDSLDALIKELLACLSAPLCPAASLCISAFVRIVVKEIADVTSGHTGSRGASTSTGPTDTTKTDISFVNFLVDILGGLGARLRETIVLAKKEAHRAENIQLPRAVIMVLRRQVDEMLNQVREDDSGRCADSETVLGSRTISDSSTGGATGGAGLKETDSGESGKRGSTGASADASKNGKKGKKRGKKKSTALATGESTSSATTTTHTATLRLNSSHFNVHDTLKMYAVLAGTALDIMLRNESADTEDVCPPYTTDRPGAGVTGDVSRSSVLTHSNSSPAGMVPLPVAGPLLATDSAGDANERQVALPQQSLGAGGGGEDGGLVAAKDVAIPSLPVILRQCGLTKAEHRNVFAVVSPSDLYNWCILENQLALLRQDVLPYQQQHQHQQQWMSVFQVSAVLWLRDALRRENLAVALYILQIMREVECGLERVQGLSSTSTTKTPSHKICGSSGGSPCVTAPHLTSLATSSAMIGNSLSLFMDSCSVDGGVSSNAQLKSSGSASKRHFPSRKTNPEDLLIALSSTSALFSAEWAHVCYRLIACTDRSLQSDFNHVVKLLLMLFSQPSPQIRARVVRSLSVLVHADSSLLTDPEIRDCVIERFNDVSISVREETVKLVGGYMMQKSLHVKLEKEEESMIAATASDVIAGGSKSRSSCKDLRGTSPPVSHIHSPALVSENQTRVDSPMSSEREHEVLDGYLSGLLVRLRDRGVSVRKSVVHILREVLLHQPSHPRYAEICRHLLERCWLPREEDTLKDVIRSTFQQVWFNPAPTEAVQAAARATPVKSLTSSSENLTKALQDEPTHAAALVYSQGTSGAEVESGLQSTPSTMTIIIPPGENSESKPNLQRLSMAQTSPYTATSLPGMVMSSQLHAETTVAQIVSVIGSTYHQHSMGTGGGSGMGSEEDWLVQMLRDMLHGNNTGSEASAQVRRRRVVARRHCRSLVSHLFELLLRAEESLHSQPPTPTTGPANGVGATGQGAAQATGEIVAIFITLACFCKAHPPYVMAHLHTLLPYLKGDNRLATRQAESIVCLKLTQMLSMAFLVPPDSAGTEEGEDEGDAAGGLSLDFEIWQNKAEEIGADLTRVALTYSSAPNIQSAVECLARLATYVCHHARHLLILGQKCFGAIASAAAQSAPVLGNGFKFKVPPSQLARIQRSIVVLGCICEQTNQCPELGQLSCDSNTHLHRSEYTQTTSRSTSGGAVEMNDLEVAKMSLHVSSNPSRRLATLQDAAINGSCFVCVKFCLAVDDAMVQTRAAQALCSVFIGNSALMMHAEETGVLQLILNGTYGASVQDKMLQSLRHVLLMEEARLEHGAAIDQMRQAGTNLGTKIQGADHIADSTITGTILQHHLGLLSTLLLDHAEPAVRLSALELMGTLLNHGMVHPLDVIAMFVSLQGDTEVLVRQTALSLLVAQDEKHASFLDNRLLDGIELTHHIQQKHLHTSCPYVLHADSDSALVAANDPLARGTVSVFTNLYKTLIRCNKKRRNELITGLLRRCEVHFQQVSMSRKAMEQVAVSCRSPLGQVLQIIADQQLLMATSRMESDSPAGAEVNNISESLSVADDSSPSLRIIGQDIPDGCVHEPSKTSSGHSKRGRKPRPQLPATALSSATPSSAETSSTVNSSVATNILPVDRTTRQRKITAAKKTTAATGGSCPEETHHRAVLSTALEHLRMVSFLGQTAASLPFDLQEEPLMCIYWISRNIPVGSGIFHQHFTRLLTGIVGNSVGDCDGGNQRGGGSSCSFKRTKLPSSSLTEHEDNIKWMDDKYAMFISNRSDYQQQLLQQYSGEHACNPCLSSPNACVDDVVLALACIESRCREVLLRLKTFLKVSFALSDERCLAFTPLEDSGSSAQFGGVTTTSGTGAGGGKGLVISDRDKQRHLDSCFAPLPPSATTTYKTESSGDDDNGEVNLMEMIAAWCAITPRRGGPSAARPGKSQPMNGSGRLPHDDYDEVGISTGPAEPLPALSATDNSLRRLLQIAVADHNRLNVLLHTDGDDYQHISKVKRKPYTRHVGRVAGAKASRGMRRANREDGEGGGSDSGSECSYSGSSECGSDVDSDGFSMSDAEDGHCAEGPSRRGLVMPAGGKGKRRLAAGGMRTRACKHAKKSRSSPPFLGLSSIPEVHTSTGTVCQLRTSARKRQRTNRLIEMNSGNGIVAGNDRGGDAIEGDEEMGFSSDSEYEGE